MDGCSSSVFSFPCLPLSFSPSLFSLPDPWYLRQRRRDCRADDEAEQGVMVGKQDVLQVVMVTDLIEAVQQQHGSEQQDAQEFGRDREGGYASVTVHIQLWFALLRACERDPHCQPRAEQHDGEPDAGQHLKCHHARRHHHQHGQGHARPISVAVPISI